jgi:hypothetical protein
LSASARATAGAAVVWRGGRGVGFGDDASDGFGVDGGVGFFSLFV